ncbi:hypothetical protein REPUB_Repub06bG0152200 [Reevesia pubescens]
MDVNITYVDKFGKNRTVAFAFIRYKLKSEMNRAIRAGDKRMMDGKWYEDALLGDTKEDVPLNKVALQQLMEAESTEEHEQFIAKAVNFDLDIPMSDMMSLCRFGMKSSSGVWGIAGVLSLNWIPIMSLGPDSILQRCWESQSMHERRNDLSMKEHEGSRGHSLSVAEAFMMSDFDTNLISSRSNLKGDRGFEGHESEAEEIWRISELLGISFKASKESLIEALRNLEKNDQKKRDKTRVVKRALVKWKPDLVLLQETKLREVKLSLMRNLWKGHMFVLSSQEMLREVDVPLFLGKDFNVMRNTEEKSRVFVNMVAMNHFNNYVDSMGLVDLLWLEGNLHGQGFRMHPFSLIWIGSYCLLSFWRSIILLCKRCCQARCQAHCLIINQFVYAMRNLIGGQSPFDSLIIGWR